MTMKDLFYVVPRALFIVLVVDLILRLGGV